MALNPSQKPESLNNPTQRANQVNDPQFENQQGYFPYDLTHQELLTPRFGEYTPSLHMPTVPSDRIVCKDNTKLIRNQIDGNLLSQLNQYVDSFFVSQRVLFPNNYEKLIPNPIKGSDLPNSALPIVPFSLFVKEYLTSEVEYFVSVDGDETTFSFNDFLALDYFGEEPLFANFYISRLSLLATVLSRGQLLDYLGLQFDSVNSPITSDVVSEFQTKIDDFFSKLYVATESLRSAPLRLNRNQFLDLEITNRPYTTLPEWRMQLSDIFEAGHLPWFSMNGGDNIDALYDSVRSLVTFLLNVFSYNGVLSSYINDVNTSSNPFQLGHLNISSVLAYQLIVAQYGTNNTVDNIFNSDLYMQLLRATMYPSEGNFSTEPTFLYNGVATEYDYISAGGFYWSLISSRNEGHLNRQYVWLTLMMIMRRSLRYGDYFSTARPRMLAVDNGQLMINVQNGMVSPIDVTKNLLMQRYLNAANYIGSGFLQYFASIYGVTPSDVEPVPRYIAHRTISLQNQITNNTATEQGKQSTNLVGYSDDTAFDVFIDDFGVLLNLVSFDVLPVYTSGIDSSFYFADRFDYFNPMLQNVGDQPIYLSEMCGDPNLHDDVFGYTMRNAEYKFKLSKAHGAFATNELAGYLMKYPVEYFSKDRFTRLININPDFIRDKPFYLDELLRQTSGTSPCQYWHFIVSCTNVVKTARKIQATPPVLF